MSAEASCGGFVNSPTIHAMYCGKVSSVHYSPQRNSYAYFNNGVLINNMTLYSEKRTVNSNCKFPILFGGHKSSFDLRSGNKHLSIE
jgi:hypothetical protein